MQAKEAVLQECTREFMNEVVYLKSGGLLRIGDVSKNSVGRVKSVGENIDKFEFFCCLFCIFA